ncbi:MAG: hypothetical protein CL489_03160 [Acidobacteria bacterium]|nr:hypothetical protein [Acidobacteriota bacterium]|tara:strand:- start:925 stop:1380 length:456 start_codon:yes stop_codon:yes gene_type:complete
MADVVRGFQNWDRISKTATSYPWDDWFDGQQWRLTEEDLLSMPFDDLARYAHKKAAQVGIRVKCKRIEFNRKTGKYKAMIMEATCPRCRAIHSDLLRKPRGNEKAKECFLNGFSPRYESEEFVARRNEYLAGVVAGFGYKTVASGPQEGKK